MNVCDLCLLERTIFQLALFINISFFLMTSRSLAQQRIYCRKHTTHAHADGRVYIFIHASPRRLTRVR